MVYLAKTAGFCFGVNRAVEKVEELLANNERVYTLGPIIHNPQVVSNLESRGVRAVDSPSEVEDGGVLVIRSHGVPLSVYDELKNAHIRHCDATCPFVAKIHKIVSSASASGGTVLIAGDATHPEVLGIKGHCLGDVFVFSDDKELCTLLRENPHLATDNVYIVAQTTYNTQLWQRCSEIAKKVCTNATVFDTICNATLSRQQEAGELSERCDLMLVIGGRHSSNTAKLLQICELHSKSFLIETAEEIPIDAVMSARHIGITAGASTPADVIKEVVLTVSDINNGENFAAMYEESESLRQNSSNAKVVHGTIVQITPNEVYVDVGRKQSGVCVLEELTDDPNLTCADCVKVGDEMDFVILRTNDQEGYIYLSKLRFDSYGAWDELMAAAPKVTKKRRRRDDEDTLAAAEGDEPAAEEKTEEAEAAPAEEKEPVVFEGVVTEVNKGGVVVTYKGIRVFVPGAHATMSRSESTADLLKKKVQFQLLEVEIGPRGKRAVGSIKNVAFRERRAKVAKFWNEVEEGKIYQGTVRSIVPFGAFVDLGGVDGLVHITELSWGRINNPSEVVSVGDVIEVFVKGIDREKKKISLGYKRQEDNPWEIMKRDYPIGTVIQATVVNTTTFGVFVNILPGIDGLIHISQLSNTRVAKPTDVVNIGDVVTAVITEVDFDKRRISLSIRQLLEAQEEGAEEAAEEEAVAEESAE